MIVGIDPGYTGAVAAVVRSGDLVAVEDMPVVQLAGKKRIAASLLFQLLQRWSIDLVVIERVAAMPKQGVSSTFNFGYGAGVLEGICAAMQVPILFVSPNTWKAAVKVTRSKGSSRLMAQRLWPAHASRFAMVKDDGRAEAALIAFHGRTLWDRGAR